MLQFNPATGEFKVFIDHSQGNFSESDPFSDQNNDIRVLSDNHPQYITSVGDVSPSDLFETKDQVSKLSALFIDYIKKAVQYDDPSEPSAPFDKSKEMTEIIFNGREKLLVHAFTVKFLANNYLRYANTGMISLDDDSKATLEKVIESLNL